MTALETATQLVIRWVSECSSVDPNKRDALLIQMIAAVLDRIEEAAYERGWHNGAAE